jgi:hypothetical protein
MMVLNWYEYTVQFANKKWSGIISYKLPLKITCQFLKYFFKIFDIHRFYYYSGVLGIVWHGYSDAELNKWQDRKRALLAVLKKPLSKYVIHSVSFGSEPLFSWSISGTFVAELQKIKGELKTLDIPLTVSEVSHSLIFYLFISVDHWYLSKL